MTAHHLVIEQIERLFRDFAEQKRVPGLTFGIIMDGELIHTNAIGVRNAQSPAAPDSVFRIASMTKSFTAMSVMRLRDEGKLRLDDPVAEYVPELAKLSYPTSDSAPITIRQLLTMSAGFPEDNPWGDRQLDIEPSTLSEWMAVGIPFSNAPGVTFEYSNYNYAILGRIVTNVSGMPYENYATNHILQPLGMTSSTYDIRGVGADRLAIGHRLEDDNWVEETPLADGEFGAMGGLFTTIPDFARYMSFLLSAYPPRDDAEREPLRRSSLREMQQPWRFNLVAATRTTPDAPLNVLSEGYGYGLSCRNDSSLGYSVSHGGGLPGYGTFYVILPDYNAGIVAFANLTYMAPRVPIYDSLLLLKTEGVIKPRTRSLTPVLQSMQAAIVALYDWWYDDKAKTLATESFFQDMPLEKRRDQFVQLRADLGKCLTLGEFRPENALRGRWRMDCEHGSLELFATLAPTMPPRVQMLQVTVIKPLSPELRKAIVALMRLIDNWDIARFRPLFSPQIKRASMESQLAAVNVEYGPLKLGEVLEYDGKSQARVRLVGERGNVDVRLSRDAGNGRIREITFAAVQ